MGDLCSCWDAMNIILVLQHTTIKTSFKKNVIKPRFNSPLYKKLRGFVSQDILFHELQHVDTIGTNNSTCGYIVRVTHSLPCACELKRFISIYDSIPLSCNNILWTLKMSHQMKLWLHDNCSFVRPRWGVLVSHSPRFDLRTLNTTLSSY